MNIAMTTKSRLAAGGIVLGQGGTVALVVSKKGNGCFFFPKGHIEGEETSEDAARREIAEETGLVDLERIADLGVYERPSLKLDGVTKSIHMFLFSAVSGAVLTPGDEIREVRWVHYQKAADEFEHLKDRVWYMSVFDRVREAIQRD